ncbi:MAG: hypothetical protein AAF423_13885 [Pseudomonadota bacterium]
MSVSKIDQSKAALGSFAHLIGKPTKKPGGYLEIQAFTVEIERARVTLTLSHDLDLGRDGRQRN